MAAPWILFLFIAFSFLLKISGSIFLSRTIVIMTSTTNKQKHSNLIRMAQS